MKERPILFSAPMVRAILDGRKTQTRRIMKPQPDSVSGGVPFGDPPAWAIRDGAECGSAVIPCPYGKRGDRLWVRETFRPIASGEVKNGYGEVRYGYAYKADSAVRWNERPTIIHDLTGQLETGPMQFQPPPWKPSIHMPRRASRIVLEVTDVRVERLQDISEEDAIAEGTTGGHGAIQGYNYNATPQEHFRHLWRQINGPGSWDKNPFVWAVSFRRVLGDES